MNTIQITTAEGAVNYTEAEITRFIEKAGQIDKLQEQIRKVRYEVRDFFSEGEWSDGETTVNKGDVNMLLDSIGADKLTTRYNANFTITGTVNIEVEDENEIESMFADNVSVEAWGMEIEVDSIELLDIEEDE